MNELNQLINVKDIVNKIRQEITSSAPSSNLVINQLYKLQDLLYENLPHFYDIVAETFMLNPEFFMESIYGNSLFQKGEITKYIVEKYCLYDEEQILLEFHGDIKQVDDIHNNIYVLVKGGTIFVTNYRIIAQGKLKAKGHSLNAYIWGGPIIWSLSGSSKRAKSKNGIISSSAGQELPCYGYQFKRQNLMGLNKKTNSVRYLVHSDDVQNMSGASTFKQLRTLGKSIRIITISPPLEQIDPLYNLLLREDVETIVDRFQRVIDMGLNIKMKKKNFSKGLQVLWKKKEYEYLSKSEKMGVVLGVYKLDPEFFMSSIYPEMDKWKFPSFLNIK
ncbi:MAG: hypothetical protein ACFFDF_01885, partial [Candidatus Odinarchaeota archaeon]